MSDVTEGYLALDDAGEGYDNAHLYYAGEVAERFASRRLARKLSRHQWRVNLAKTPVDSAADRLEIVATRVVTGTDPTDTDELLAASDADNALLTSVWDANAMLFEAPNIMRRACEYGDAFVLVWEATADGGLPVINYHSPSSMRVIYDRENPRLKRFAVQWWCLKDITGMERHRVNLWYADRVEKWVTKVAANPEKPESWEPYLEDGQVEGDHVVSHDYGEVPVFHFRTTTAAAGYGTPLHYHGYGVQDAYNKIVATHMSSIDYHAAPQRYALTDDGATDGDDDFDDDEDWNNLADEPGPITSQMAEQRHGGSGLRSGAGEVWWLKGVKSVGQFDPAAAAVFIEPLNFYAKVMAQVTTTPFEMFDESAVAISGESRRRKEGPFTKKVRDLQMLFASEWANLLAFALKVAGAPGRKVDVRFAPAEVVGDAEGWSTIKSKIEAGVPVRQALLEAGYTDDQVDDWYPEGEENTFRVTDLVVVADILQKIGAAVALGLISKEEARNMLPEGILPESAPGTPVPGPAAPPSPVPVPAPNGLPVGG